MCNKILISLILILIILQNVNALQTTSSNYQTDSVISNGGKNVSSSNYKTNIISGINVGNTSSSLYQKSIGFFFCTPYTCASLGYNCGSWSDNCGNTLDCGSCASGYTCSAGTCTSVTPGDGGPSAGCTYNWVCSEWYPEPCPQERIQKRVCVNRGTCRGKTGMPATNRTCIPKIVSPTEPLFDIFAKIPLIKKWITPGESVKANIELINLGNTTMLDVFFRYWVVDENNTLIAELQETRAISERDKFQVEIILPSDIKIGLYKFYAQISYDEDKVAMAQDSFEVVESKIGKFILPIFLIIIIFIAIIFLILIVIKLKRKKKKYKVRKRKDFFKYIFKKKKKERSFKDYKKRINKKIKKYKR